MLDEWSMQLVGVLTFYARENHDSEGRKIVGRLEWVLEGRAAQVEQVPNGQQ